MKYTTLMTIKELYTHTTQETIKDNIKRQMEHNNTKHNDLIELCTIKLQTAYSYTNKANKAKPDLLNLLILASYWKIDITELLRDR